MTKSLHYYRIHHHQWYFHHHFAPNLWWCSSLPVHVTNRYWKWGDYHHWLVTRTVGDSPSLSTKRSRQSTKGYAQGSDLSVDRCASYELYGDARHNKVLSRFGHREGVIPTSCVWFVLLCIMRCVLRGSLARLI
jgi:hypothetical protein